MTNRKFLTLTQLAAYLGLSKKTLYRMIADGRFPVPSIPEMFPRRWNIEAIDKWRLANDNS